MNEGKQAARELQNPYRKAAVWLLTYVGLATGLYGAVGHWTAFDPQSGGPLLRAIFMSAITGIGFAPYAVVLAAGSAIYVGPVLLLWTSAARRFAVLESSIFAIAALSAVASAPLGLWFGSVENVHAGWAAFLTAWLGFWLPRVAVRSLRPAWGPWRKQMGSIAAFAAVLLSVVVVQVRHVNVAHVIRSSATRIPEVWALPQFGGRLGKRQSSHAWSYGEGSDSEEAVVLALNEVPCSAIEIRSSELARTVPATGQPTTVLLGIRATFDRIIGIRPMAVGSWKMPDKGIPGTLATSCDRSCACVKIGQRASAIKLTPIDRPNPGSP